MDFEYSTIVFSILNLLFLESKVSSILREYVCLTAVITVINIGHFSGKELIL